MYNSKASISYFIVLLSAYYGFICHRAVSKQKNKRTYSNPIAKILRLATMRHSCLHEVLIVFTVVGKIIISANAGQRSFYSLVSLELLVLFSARMEEKQHEQEG
jgi:hypothetical protein